MEDLTEREKEALLCASCGYTTKETGLILKLSPHTIKNHLTNIRLKLGAFDTTHAVGIALRRGTIL